MSAEKLLHLAKGLCFTESKNSLKLTCLKGVLWITQPGVGQDIIIKAGESQIFSASKGKLVAQALQDSSFIITPLG